MDLTIEKKIGNKIYPFTVHGENLFDLIQESQKLSFYDINKCGVCGSDLLYLRSHIAQKKYKYVVCSCASCKAQLIFGHQTEEPNTFYARKDKNTKSLDWQKYEENKEWKEEENV